MSDSASQEAIERYRGTLFEMAAEVGDLGHPPDERHWERLTDRLEDDQAVLEDSAEGRAAIQALLDDPRPTVRFWSGVATLGWDESSARPVLEELREDPLKYGLHSIMAKHTLLEHDGVEDDDDTAR